MATWGTSLVVRQVMHQLIRYVDRTPDLYGYVVNDAAEEVVVVHRPGAPVGRHQLSVQAILLNAEATIAAELARLTVADVSDLTTAEGTIYRRDLAERGAIVPADVDVRVVFRPACREDAGDLDRVEAAVATFDWADSSLPDDYRIAIDRNLSAGQIVVSLPDDRPASRSARRLLLDAFGDDVSVVIDADHMAFSTETQVTGKPDVPGAVLQPGRYADAAPHMGGVQVGDWQFDRGACTTGFAIDVDGGRSMLTAGHCSIFLPIGTWLYSGVHAERSSHWSFGRFYRSWWNEEPLIDVGLIGSSRQTYRRTIYTDPDPSGVTERLVTAVWEPWVGARGVCFSGSFTGNVCDGVIVGSTTACLRGGPVSRCGRVYAAESASGRPVSQKGDSGGPVYLPSGQSHARALGIITGKQGDRTTFVGSTAIYRATGGWIAHTCCDDTSAMSR